MRELGDDVTFGERNDPQPLLRQSVADLERGGGYGVKFFEPFTAEVIPELEGFRVASVVRCFAHD